MVEDIISESIETKLKFLRQNPDILDRIFKQSSITNRNRIKEFVANSSVKVLRGYPITQASLPCYTILLGGEQERPGGLDNYLGDQESDEDGVITDTFTETVPFNPVTANFITTHKPLVSIDSVVYEGVQYDGSFAEIQNPLQGIVGISGSGMVETNITVTYTYRKHGYSTYGTMYLSQYRVECWSGNADLTINLYQLLKWIFLSSRSFFSTKNLFVQSLGGLDFEPAPEYFPEFVFRRALTFDCMTDATYEVEYDYIEGFVSGGGIAE
ncbi:hypothetical protein D3C81_1426400 [compost metagenome]